MIEKNEQIETLVQKIKARYDGLAVEAGRTKYTDSDGEIHWNDHNTTLLEDIKELEELMIKDMKQ